MGQAAAANETFKRPLALSSERTRAEEMEAAPGTGCRREVAFKRPLALSSERTRATILTAMRIAAHAIAIGKKADAADSHLGYV